MARCKLTRMSLRNIRKDKQYQCIVIDFVRTGVIGKSKAEELLGYTIPAGLLGSSTPTTPDDDDEEEPDNTVTLLYYKSAATEDDTPEWLTAEYDLTSNANDIAAGIIDFAKDAFSDDSLNSCEVAEENPSYVDGDSAVAEKYIPLDPQPVTIEPGMLVIVSAKELSL